MASRSARKPRPAKPRPRRAAPEARRAPQQDRGQKRIDALLDAAEQVIVQAGVDGMTTNAVAERAGAGMGSLYHFFASKEAILAALAERYMSAMRSLTQYSSQDALRTLLLAALADAIIDPLAEFFRRTPAYPHVFHAIDRPCARDRACGELHEAATQQVEAIIAARVPGMDPKARRIHATASVEMVHALLTAAFAAPASQRADLIAETKRLLALHAEMMEKGDDPLTRLR